MERTAVESRTGMCGYAYDAATQTLEIAFKPKEKDQPEKVYHYKPFAPKDWEAFVLAESKGSHFCKFIKPKFTCTKVESEQL